MGTASAKSMKDMVSKGIQAAVKDLDVFYAYYTPKMSCSFPESHPPFTHPMSAKDVSPAECFAGMLAANLVGSRYQPSNIRLLHVAVNGTVGSAQYKFDLGGLINGVPVPGAILHDVGDLVT